MSSVGERFSSKPEFEGGERRFVANIAGLEGRAPRFHFPEKTAKKSAKIDEKQLISSDDNNNI
jgi:hypothetical protein